MEAKYREVCEGLGWVVYKYEAGLVEVSKHSAPSSSITNGKAGVVSGA